MKKDFLHTKEDGFKLPDDYFSKFEDTLFDSTTKKSEVHLPNNNGFQIPEKYFENIEERILSKLEKEKQPRNNFKKLYYYVGGIAAALALTFSILNMQTPTAEKQLHKLSATDVENYIEDGYLSVNTYDIGELFSDEINDIPITASIEDDAIIDYLVTYGISEEP